MFRVARRPKERHATTGTDGGVGTYDGERRRNKGWDIVPGENRESTNVS